MSFPSGFDSLSPVNPGDPITDTHENQQSTAINNIESTLGLDTPGPYPTVAAALLGKSDIVGIQNEAYTYAADSGSANTYVVTLSPAPASYSAGLAVVFKAANANTGSSTLNVNGLGAQSLVKNATQPLGLGDISSGQMVVAIYDGTNFQTGSIAGITLPLPVTEGGTNATTASGARSSLSAAELGANNDITSLSGLTTPLSVGQGGTGSSSPGGALSALGAAASGANSDITSLSGLTTPLSLTQGGTGSGSLPTARTNLGAAGSGANSDITSLSGLTTPLSVVQGGTGSGTANGARSNLNAAGSGSNSDITSLSGLTTPLSAAQGGTGVASPTANGVLVAQGSSAMTVASPVHTGYVLTDNGPGQDPSFQAVGGGAVQFQALSDL